MPRWSHNWSHNAYYQRLLLRQLPRPCRRVLDVGCGAGEFAARLAEHSDQVDAVDRDAPMIEQARQTTPDNVHCVLADVLTDPLPAKDYDAIVSISALHHMPLPETLPVLAAGLRPGGILAAVALPRLDLRHEWPVEFVAAIAHHTLGVVFLANRLLWGTSTFSHEHHTRTGMPVVMNPPLTTREVARQAAAVLPGVRVRRLLFWRYLLTWEKPVFDAGSPDAPRPLRPTE
ncbi:class I SAM-dependent methyltransferase [Pseudofrankia inefficax]|uniref:class I SAM-dependent methyltransferase n=1 Tax=Pseudofrankia inefficax (strain DSM 45817 / CECT 9037 / DDB 130130 / EuI1c) TaxID=298654 RepID=UPI0002FE346B|nr:class I SAM-dependent methyltransferase [Pseudofrankia inefficax]